MAACPFLSMVDPCCALRCIGNINVYLDEPTLICYSKCYELAWWLCNKNVRKSHSRDYRYVSGHLEMSSRRHLDCLCMYVEEHCLLFMWLFLSIGPFDIDFSWLKDYTFEYIDNGNLCHKGRFLIVFLNFF